MPPMYPIGPDGAGMFFGLIEQKLDAAELSDALTRAILKKDTARARELFDHAFWHQTTFKPDWFHLYQAVERQDRPMVKLLTTYGATWTEDQAKILTVALADKLEGLTGILHAAGIRTDYTQQDIQHMDILPALQMNKRIIDENKKNGANTAAEEKKFSHAVYIGMANAVLRNEMQEAKHLLALHPDAQNPHGYDISGIFAGVLGDFLNGSSTRAISFVDRLQAEGVKLQPIRLEAISSTMIDQHYDLLPALEKRGLLSEDRTKLRDRLLSAWPYLQSTIDLDGYKFHIMETLLNQKRSQYNTAAQTLCTESTPLARGEVDSFLRRHALRVQSTPEGVRHMDKALLATGFFNNPAFAAADLKTLADTNGLDAELSRAFNKLAARKQIADKSIESLLHPKRFDTLAQALAAGVIQPDATETEQIVDYLHRHMKKETPSPEAIAVLQSLKNTGADFYRIGRRDYLGHSKPGMAKALLDLDIISPQNINRVKLQKRCGGPVTLGMDSLTNTTHKHYAMREFLCQIELEKAAPEEFKPLRGKPDTSYQRLYITRRMRMIMSAKRETGQRTDPRTTHRLNHDDIRRMLEKHRRVNEQEMKERQEYLRKILQKHKTVSNAREETLRRILREHGQKQKLTDEHREAIKRILERHNNPPKPPKPPKPRFGY